MDQETIAYVQLRHFPAWGGGFYTKFYFPHLKRYIPATFWRTADLKELLKVNAIVGIG